VTTSPCPDQSGLQKSPNQPVSFDRHPCLGPAPCPRKRPAAFDRIVGPGRLIAFLVSRALAAISAIRPGLTKGAPSASIPHPSERSPSVEAFANREIIGAIEYPFDTSARRKSDVPPSGRYMPFHGASTTAQPCRAAHLSCSVVTPVGVRLVGANEGLAAGSNHTASWSEPGIRNSNCPFGKDRFAFDGTSPVASMH
jgi:hypothetical protein